MLNNAHIPLPSGWFFTCGRYTFNYIPANMSHGTRCCLSRLTIFLPSSDVLKHMPAQRMHKRSIPLSEDCDDSVNLLSKAEYNALTFSLVGIPALAVGAYKEVMKLACAMVKNINYTSTAISMLNDEQKQHRQAILDNRAAIDYLLLLHHKSCSAVKGMCCFNLTDDSVPISQELERLKHLVEHIRQDSGNEILTWLTSWLPDFAWLKRLFVGLCLFLIIIIIVVPVARCVFSCSSSRFKRF